MRRIKTQFNFKPSDIDGEVYKLPHKTQPNQVLSVRQMLERQAAGLPVRGSTKVPMYLGEENDLIDITHLDYADQEAIKNEYRKEMDRIKTGYKNMLDEDRARKLKAKERPKNASDGNTDDNTNNPKKTPPEAGPKDQTPSGQNRGSEADA